MVVSNIFYFHPYLGKIPILTNIFQIELKPPLDGFKTWTSSFGDVLTDVVTMGFITIKPSCEGTCFIPFPTILT